ncbi:antibiotic biosynthesis monooxygenase family protein [Pelagibacterium lentulum]|uniref:Antibiotic biosynthesis monooxygenase n=1 Tax=Pelagibacterium lentulum TaxID=2029865 RepID=A0A916RL15_9HYPH|nr:antibiotic biosynthesis monooxygenase [Pelagibacterium lentulum]GGA61236.1 antibiotic biosynthesis monooxygenase [Pelagibacterium lentulum]
MFIAMNRFKVKTDSVDEFEAVWKTRKSRLDEMEGFIDFKLLRGPANRDENYTLYVSHSTWASYDAFESWTKSQNFRDAHKQAGDTKPSYIGSPAFEGFSIVEGA